MTSAMVANVVHLYTYHESILNFFPTVPVVVCLIFAFASLMSAFDAEGLFFVALGFGIVAAILGLCFPWHHTELRHGAEMQIQVNHQSVWIPATRLPNGVYWPTGTVRRHK